MHSNMQNAIMEILDDVNYLETVTEDPGKIQKDFDLNEKEYKALNSELPSGPRVVADNEVSSCVCICCTASVSQLVRK